MREESKSLRKGSGLVWSEPQWIHRISLLFPLTRASLQVTLLPCSSLLSKCYFFMPPFNAIPTTHPSRRSRPQETSSNPWRHFCLHLPAQPLKLKKYFSFPFLSVPDHMRQPPERTKKTQTLVKMPARLFPLKNPQMLCFFCFLCLAPHSCEIP